MPYADASFVCAPLDRSRETRPAITSRADAPSVHRSLPHVRDDGRRPSSRDRMARVLLLICPTATAEYFLSKRWTAFTDLPVVLFCRALLAGLRLRAPRSSRWGGLQPNRTAQSGPVGRNPLNAQTNHDMLVEFTTNPRSSDLENQYATAFILLRAYARRYLNAIDPVNEPCVPLA